jgi:hypothetical protein
MKMPPKPMKISTSGGFTFSLPQKQKWSSNSSRFILQKLEKSIKKTQPASVDAYSAQQDYVLDQIQ